MLNIKRMFLKFIFKRYKYIETYYIRQIENVLLHILIEYILRKDKLYFAIIQEFLTIKHVAQTKSEADEKA